MHLNHNTTDTKCVSIIKNNILNHMSKLGSTSRIIFITILVLVFGLGCTYIGLRIWFKSDINQICDDAMNQYEGDKIEALISVLKSESQSLNNKNNAIWALGKLKATDALPVLRSLKTGAECDHSRFVCQRELDKAISTIEGTSFDILTFR